MQLSELDGTTQDLPILQTAQHATPKPWEKVRQKLGMLDKNQISRWKLCESYTAVSVLAKSNFWAAQAMQDPTSFKNKIYRLGSWVGKLQEHALSKRG